MHATTKKIMFALLIAGNFTGSIFALIRTDLWKAVKEDRIEDLQYLLKQPEADVSYVNKGWTLLHLACFNNKIELAKVLLQHGAHATINMANINNWTSLAMACRSNNIELAKLLLEHGAHESINMANQLSKTPLYWASRHKNTELVSLLKKYGAK